MAQSVFRYEIWTAGMLYLSVPILLSTPKGQLATYDVLSEFAYRFQHDASFDAAWGADGKLAPRADGPTIWGKLSWEKRWRVFVV